MRDAVMKTSHTGPKKVLDSLGTCPVFVAVRQLPDLPTDDNGRLAEDVSLPVLTSDGPEGEVLFVFTSLAELRKRSAEAASLVTDLGGVVRMLPAVAAGIVLDPEGNCLFLSREEIGATPTARLTRA
ncbi:MAG: SseB family protein [Pirellulaceae bacterium]|nr:SseB family protein [Pirellulaceae bacterium]